MSNFDLVEAFDSLVILTANLCQCIRQQHEGIWVPLTAAEQAQGLTPVEKACQILQDFWYQDGQDGRETRSCFGFIALPESVLELASQVNAQKDHLKRSVQALQKTNKQQWLELKGELSRRHPSIQEQLHFSGLSRLHIKQTWRTIPVISRTPTRIGFNWYHSGRSIQKMTVQQAYDALAKLDTSSTHIQTQLSAVSQLANNTPLAKVQNLAPTMRANIFFEDGEAPLRQAMNISLPILFKAHKKRILPQHNEPEIMPPASRQRAVRSDRKIEDEPFLPSIRVHRYNP
ncbi:MAG: DNA replication terminus site-binding protein [Gammaproteobacteria bacterium]|nr:DNA replication terminus site-binding protein [Gammaproteobacteria bacterium]